MEHFLPPPPVIACVKWGERYGAYYANALCDMVRLNLPENTAYDFQCFTDDATGLSPSITVRPLPGDLTGWWNKLHLFKEEIFNPGRRILYFDLDTLVLSGIEDLLHYAGNFALLRDFYRPEGYGSGVMLWRAEACYPIWTRFADAGRPMPAGGDQAWIERAYPDAERLQDRFPGTFASFKTDCHPLPPPGTRVVCFHGEPKQDNCDALWVKKIWNAHGMHGVEQDYLTLQEKAAAHTRDAMTKPYAWIERKAPHARAAILVGGGATLHESKEELLGDIEQGGDVFAVNRATLWLESNAIPFKAHIAGDMQHETALFAHEVACYYASSCSPSALEKAGNNLTLWNPLSAHGGPGPSIGKTAGLHALWVAHMLGYRRFHLYGFDSCYIADAHHAYAHPEEDCNRRFTAELHGRRFQGSMWMLQQADDFMQLADRFIVDGCLITIHGDGLLHFLATQAQHSAENLKKATP